MTAFWTGFEKRGGSLGTKRVVRAYKRAIKNYNGAEFNKLMNKADDMADKSRLKDMFREDRRLGK